MEPVNPFRSLSPEEASWNNQQHQQAEQFLSANKFSDALRLYERLDKTGDGKASYQIGWMHKNGLGRLLPDLKDAKEFFSKAAERDYIPGYIGLGDICFAEGKYKEAYDNYCAAYDESQLSGALQVWLNVANEKIDEKDLNQACAIYAFLADKVSMPINPLNKLLEAGKTYIENMIPNHDAAVNILKCVYDVATKQMSMADDIAGFFKLIGESAHLLGDAHENRLPPFREVQTALDWYVIADNADHPFAAVKAAKIYMERSYFDKVKIAEYLAKAVAKGQSNLAGLAVVDYCEHRQIWERKLDDNLVIQFYGYTDKMLPDGIKADRRSLNAGQDYFSNI